MTAITEDKKCTICKLPKKITAFPADPRPRADGSIYRYPYCYNCKRKKAHLASAAWRTCPCCGEEKAYTSFPSKHADICRVCAGSAPVKPNCNPWLLRAW